MPKVFNVYAPYAHEPSASVETLDDALEFVGETLGVNWTKLSTTRYADGSHSVSGTKTGRLLPYSIVESDHYPS